jgi:hypothetical protein
VSRMLPLLPPIGRWEHAPAAVLLARQHGGLWLEAFKVTTLSTACVLP